MGRIPETNTCRPSPLLLLLLAQASITVEHTDVQLLGALHDSLAVGGGYVVGDLSGEHTVVHQQQLELLDVEDAELLEAVGEDVLGLVVGAVSDLHLLDGALKAAAEPGVDTAGTAPARL